MVVVVDDDDRNDSRCRNLRMSAAAYAVFTLDQLELYA